MNRIFCDKDSTEASINALEIARSNNNVLFRIRLSRANNRATITNIEKLILSLQRTLLLTLIFVDIRAPFTGDLSSERDFILTRTCLRYSIWPSHIIIREELVSVLTTIVIDDGQRTVDSRYHIVYFRKTSYSIKISYSYI